jgi:Ca2+-binding RTX toxin-like protein
VSYARFPGTQFSGMSVNLGSGSATGFTNVFKSDTLTGIENVIGSTGADNLAGSDVGNVITGGAGSDNLTGLLGADTFVFSTIASTPGSFSATASDVVTDFLSGTDKLAFSQAGVRIGDGDTLVEGGVTVAGPGGFLPTAELVIVEGNIPSFFIGTFEAAAVIGSASAAYSVGATRLFAVDNGTNTGVFLFTSSGVDSLISASELTQVASLSNTPATALADYVFTA